METERHRPELCGLARNAALPEDLLDRLVNDRLGDELSGTELAQRPDLSPAHVAALVAHGGTGAAVELVRRGLADPADVRSSPRALLYLLSEGLAPTSWAWDLVSHPDQVIRDELASAAGTPAEVLSALAGDPEVAIVGSVAGSAALPADLAATLARHPHASVRRSLAANHHAPPALLAALATDGGQPPASHCHACDGDPDRQSHRYCDQRDHWGAIHDIQLAAATNSATPPAAVAVLADHSSLLIRVALASRADLPPETYRRLADDPMPGVRWDLARNAAIGEPLIRLLAAGDSAEQRQHVAGNPAVPLDLLTAIATTTRIGPALLPRIAAATPAELGQLATSAAPQVRRLVAQRPELPPEMLALLADDPDRAVAKGVAANPAIGADQLRAIVERHGSHVYAPVARNPNCPTDLLDRITDDPLAAARAHREVARHPNASGAALMRCLTTERARPDVARHPALPAATIVRLLDDPDSRVVAAAAANPSLPVSTMRGLLPD